MPEAVDVEVVTATKEQLFKGTRALSPPPPPLVMFLSTLCHRLLFPTTAGRGCAA